MNREIKFRAWDNYKKQMLEVTDLNFFDEFIFCNENPNGDYTRLPIVGTPLMQFTGLHDKHGKEIYEGDIVSSVGKLGIVKLEKRFFDYPVDDYITGWGAGDVELSDWDLSSSIEVIGNIYENPELLETNN